MAASEDITYTGTAVTCGDATTSPSADIKITGLEVTLDSGFSVTPDGDSLIVRWGSVEGADGYKIAISYCGEFTNERIYIDNPEELENSNVATVDKIGHVRAVARGTCTIYVYAQNGVSGSVEITVK